MSKLPCLLVRYEDLCTNPDILHQIASFAQLQELGTERLSIEKIIKFRKYEIEKHGKGISAKSVNRHQKEPYGYAQSLAEIIWRRCPEYSENFHYEIPDSPYSGNISMGLSRKTARKAVLNYINEKDRILDLSCGTMSLEPMLPKSCEYIPCDTAARGKRKDILICNPNENIYPDLNRGNKIVALNLLEYLKDPFNFFKAIRNANLPLICSYHPPEYVPLEERGAIGWINHMSVEKLLNTAREFSFSVEEGTQIDNQLILQLLPC